MSFNLIRDTLNLAAENSAKKGDVELEIHINGGLIFNALAKDLYWLNTSVGKWDSFINPRPGHTPQSNAPVAAYGSANTVVFNGNEVVAVRANFARNS